MCDGLTRDKLWEARMYDVVMFYYDFLNPFLLPSVLSIHALSRYSLVSAILRKPEDLDSWAKIDGLAQKLAGGQNFQNPGL